jgi:hypothetical protein
LTNSFDRGPQALNNPIINNNPIPFFGTEIAIILIILIKNSNQIGSFIANFRP